MPLAFAVQRFCWCNYYAANRLTFTGDVDLSDVFTAAMSGAQSFLVYLILHQIR